MLATIYFPLGCILYDICFPETLQLRGPRKQRFSTRLARSGEICGPSREGLVGSLHVVTIQVGRAVDVAQVVGALVGIEDERATVVDEKVSGNWVVVVEEHVFGIGELYRDGIVVGVAGLYVAGDEYEFLLLTRA